MKRMMESEIIFLDPNQVDPAVAALEKLGFEINRLKRVDEYRGLILNPAKWLVAWLETELDERAFMDWIADLVKPLGGDVVTAGLSQRTTFEADAPEPDALH
jgi:hypothetical protein